MVSRNNYINSIHLIQYSFQKFWIIISGEIIKILNYKTADIYIIGAYHGFNVGDISMGAAIGNIASSLGINTQLIPLEKVSRIPQRVSNKYILGGGAIFSRKNLGILIKHTNYNLSNVAVLGVDLHLNHNEINLNYLKNAAFIASRASPKEEEKSIFFHKLSREDIAWHPDLTFSYYPLPKILLNQKKTNKKKVIGLNVLPFFYWRKKSQWIFKYYTDKNPYDPSIRLSVHQQKMIAQQYVSLMRCIARTYLDNEFSVYHLPFALEDDLFAKFCFANLPVKFLSYSNKPHNHFKKIQQFDKFIPTRLHAHIFAAIAKVPILSISYGSKCRNLLKHLGVPKECAIDYRLLLDDNFKIQDFNILKENGFICESDNLFRLSIESQLVMNKALKRLTE